MCGHENGPAKMARPGYCSGMTTNEPPLGKRRKVTGRPGRRATTQKYRILFHICAGIPALVLGLAALGLMYVASERGLFGDALAEIGEVYGVAIAILGGIGIALAKRSPSRTVQFLVEMVSMVGVVIGVFALIIGLSA